VAGRPLEIENDPCSRIWLPAHANLTHDVVGKGQRDVAQRGHDGRVRQVDEDPWRAVEPLGMKRRFAFELEGHPEGILQ
jgi:hypothetical protein